MNNISKHDLYYTEPYAMVKPSLQNPSKTSQERDLNQMIDIQAESPLNSVPICIEIMFEKRKFVFARFSPYSTTAIFEENLLSLFGHYLDVCW
jgi:hypothetical protein